MIWLIGCKGMLGSEIAKQLTENNIQWTGTDRDVDITDPAALENFINTTETASYLSSHNNAKGKDSGKIKWVINCSAYTAVEKAETEPELAHALNADGPLNIARVARAHGAKLIHMSTDYVFGGHGNAPFTENMEKRPLGVYGITKSAGEDNIRKEMTQYYIIRTAWLYGFDGKNFVYTMTGLMNTHDEIKVVSDQCGTPTFAGDLADVIIRIITKADTARSFFGKKSALPYGIYHFTNLGEISWYDFAAAIYTLGKKYGRITHDCMITACTTEEYGAKVERPAYSVLSKEKIQRELHIKIASWQSSLDHFMSSDRFIPR